MACILSHYFALKSESLRGEGIKIFLPVCHECTHGDVKDVQSHCSREAVFSRLTRYIKALTSFLEQQSVDELPIKVASNQ
jgi:hypothetical protein